MNTVIDFPHSSVNLPGGKTAFQKLSYGQSWNDSFHSFVVGCYSYQKKCFKRVRNPWHSKPDSCQNEKPES